MRISTYSQILIREKWILIFLEEEEGENDERERQKWREWVGFAVCGEKTKRRKEREKRIGEAEIENFEIWIWISKWK